MTVTTVGYGDLYPRDVDGRIIGTVVMFLGIGFLSVLPQPWLRSSSRDTSSDEVIETLRRIVADVAELKTRLPAD